MLSAMALYAICGSSKPSRDDRGSRSTLTSPPSRLVLWLAPSGPGSSTARQANHTLSSVSRTSPAWLASGGHYIEGAIGTQRKSSCRYELSPARCLAHQSHNPDNFAMRVGMLLRACRPSRRAFAR